jgi:hypothetical protein
MPDVDALGTGGGCRFRQDSCAGWNLPQNAKTRQAAIRWQVAYTVAGQHRKGLLGEVVSKHQRYLVVLIRGLDAIGQFTFREAGRVRVYF